MQPLPALAWLGARWEEAGLRRRNPAKRLLRRRGRAADGRLVMGVAIVAFFVLVAVSAPLLAPYRPFAYVAVPLAPPSGTHLLGANHVGQDLLSQLIYGARASVLVGAVAAALSTAIAWGLGLLSGISRSADAVVIAISDLLLVLPLLLLVILVAALLGGSLPVVVVTLGAVTWGPFARVIRGQVQAEIRKPYVEAARALGMSRVRLLWRHVGPATTGTAAAKFVMTAQYAIVAQASLAFLGLGDPGVISWGDMVHRAALSPLIFLDGSWAWAMLPPALAIGLLVVGFALIGWSVEERSLPQLVRLRLQREPPPEASREEP